MNMFKKNGGFTLVELIVVIAILAILAGVAVPAYSGYISKAQEASDLTQLDAIKTAASFAFVEKVASTTNDIVVESVEVTASSDGKTLTKVVVNEDTEVTTEVNGEYFTTFPGFKSDAYKTGATWTADSGKWE